MTSGRDDDALTWSGDDDPTLDVGSKASAPVRRRSTPRADRADAVTATSADAPAGGPAQTPASLPEGFTAVGRGSDEVVRAPADAEGPSEPAAAGERTPMGNGTLVGLGVFGGIYLLYAIGWIIGGARLWVFAVSSVPVPFFAASLGLAVAAPVLWFATAYLLTRASRTWVWMLWLLAGVVLLLPWPLLTVGTVGR